MFLRLLVCDLQYRTVAARGAMLFFLLNSLNKIHAFYQYSLNAFVTVFSRAIDVAPGERTPCCRVYSHLNLSLLLPDAAGCELLIRHIDFVALQNSPAHSITPTFLQHLTAIAHCSPNSIVQTAMICKMLLNPPALDASEIL